MKPQRNIKDRFWWVTLHLFRHSRWVYMKWCNAHFVEVIEMKIVAGEE